MEIPEPGNFFSLYGYNTRSETFSQAYNKINTIPGGWNTLAKRKEENFEFQGTKPDINDVEGKNFAKIEGFVLNFVGRHSGTLFNETMREMKAISKLGWETYATNVLKEKRDNELKRTNDTYPSNYGEQENYFPHNYQVVDDEKKPWFSWGGKKSRKYKKFKKFKKSRKHKKSKKFRKINK